MTTWRERNAEARARGRYLPEEIDLAAHWETCAVGEQHALYPDVVLLKDSLNLFLQTCKVPVDPTLTALGDGRSGFFMHLCGYNFDACDRDLDAIEARVLELKREAGSRLTDPS